jgi:hypothetical protein
MEFKDRLVTVLEDAIEGITAVLTILPGQDPGEVCDVIDRTDLAVAVTLLEKYHQLNKPVIHQLKEAVITILEYQAVNNPSADVTRAVLKLSALYNVELKGEVDTRYQSTVDEVSAFMREAHGDVKL